MRTIHIAAALLLAGCAAAPPIEMSAAPVTPIVVGSQSVSVVDLSKPSDGSPASWSPGYHRLPDSMLARPFGKALTEDLRVVVRPSGSGSTFEIWIIDAGIFMANTGVQFVPIVNIFATAGGPFKCAAIINVKRGSESKKYTVEHLVTQWDTSDLGMTEQPWKNAAQPCYTELLSKIKREIQAF